MSPAELDKMTKMTFHFSNGVVLDLGPRQYAYELRRGVWCLGVFDNEHNGAVIGAANMCARHGLPGTTRWRQRRRCDGGARCATP